MLRDGSSETGDEATWGGDCTRHDWREVDRALQRLAKHRAALDAEEARWLRIADQLQIWREVGCVSLLQYMEQRLGYKPHAAQERLRVALALDNLPGLAVALETGELPFTAVRELTRVMTPDTETAWLDAGRDKNVHEIEQLVSGHEKGDVPSDPAKPELVTKVVRYEVRPATYALIRQAKQKLEKQRGSRMTDDELIAALCEATLSDRDSNEDAGRAKYQIAMTLCERCGQGFQEAAGRSVSIDAATVERAKCDAEHIGSLDASHPARAKQVVPPRVRRFVHRRDRGKCCVTGCRSAAYLEVHHIVARADGGSHDPKNLTLLCDGHHKALHEGLLTIEGEAPDKLARSAPARCSFGPTWDIASRPGHDEGSSPRRAHEARLPQSRRCLGRRSCTLPPGSKRFARSVDSRGAKTTIEGLEHILLR